MTTYILLSVIIGIGAFFRFYRIGDTPFIGDEFWTLLYSEGSLKTVLNACVLRDTHPPLYYFLVNGTRFLLGTSELSARLVSIMSGILSIPLMYMLGSRLYSRKEGLFSALLMSLLFFPIAFSRTARSYSLLLLLSLVSVLFWLIITMRYQENKRASLGYFVGLGLSLLFLEYTHIIGFFFVILLGGVTVMVYGSSGWPLKRVGIVFVAALCASLPWLPAVFVQYQNNQGIITALYQRPGLHSIVVYFFEIFNFFTRSRVLPVAVFGFALWFGGHQLSRILKKKQDTFLKRDMLLLVWLLVPIIVLYVKSAVSFPMFYSRYLIICLPPAYLLLARALRIAFDRLPVLPAAFAVLLLANTRGISRIYLCDSYAPIAAAARALDVENSAFIVDSGTTSRAVRYYLGKKRYPRDPFVLADDIPHIARDNRLEHVWLVQGKDVRPIAPEQYDLLLQRFSVIHTENNPWFSAIQFRRKSKVDSVSRTMKIQ